MIRPPGDLVEIKGRRIHCIRLGDHPGPAIVFEAGAGLFSFTWRKVQEQVAEFATTVSWDRPGCGWSDVPDGPPGLDSATDDLRLLLDTTGVPPPYVLVAHSLGAFHARRFAERWPDLVAGLILVDPSHERQFESLSTIERLGQAFSYSVLPHVTGLLSRVGRGRILKLVRSEFPELDDAEQRGLAEVWLRPDGLRVLFSEVANAFAQAKELGSEPGSLGDLPLVVLVAGKQVGSAAFQGQRTEVQLPDLVRLSRRGRLEVVDGSGHGMQFDAPEAVVAAVREVLARSAEPVT